MVLPTMGSVTACRQNAWAMNPVIIFQQEHPKEFLFGSNEVPDLPEAIEGN
jgi:hypothetical protein